ncbi:MAG: hypothetical protein ACOX5R_11685 [bacterium]
MVEKSLDKKLAEIHADPSGSRAFIIADAKDADMAFGITATGRYSPEYHHGEVQFKSIHEYRDMMRQVVQQGLVDIMLMSASSNEVLTIQERLFDQSHITPAARANDTSDIHVMRGSSYFTMASRPFRTATIDHIQCGKQECSPDERNLGANLGLYSLTFNNDIERDLYTLERFKEFRIEAERKGFRYFMEVFDPNVPEAIDPQTLGQFINDAITRTLAGVTQKGRPVFLKIVYHGPQAMEELVHFDPHLVVGILGGGAGTTYDAFKLLAEAQKYGARAALYGRKINNAEHQLSFIAFLRLIADGEISPEEAVKAYHGVLQGLGIKPQRSLEEDSRLTSGVMSYGGNGTTVTIPAGTPATSPRERREPAPAAEQRQAVKSAQIPEAEDDGTPDFSKMTAVEKLEYNQRERDRIFG